MQSSDNYNRGGFIAFLFSVVVSFLFFIYVSFIYEGVNLKELPDVQPAEQTLAGGQEAAPKVDVSKIEKPWVTSPELVAHGKSVYDVNCKVCHGNEGKGDGPAGQALNPPPRDLIAGQWKKGGDSIALFKTVTDGLPGTSMAAFGHLPKVDRWALVHFVHSITKNVGKDDAAKVEAFAASAK